MEYAQAHTPLALPMDSLVAAAGEMVMAAGGLKMHQQHHVGNGARDKWGSQDVLHLEPQVHVFFLVSLLHTNEYLKINIVLNGVDRMDWA